MPETATSLPNPIGRAPVKRVTGLDSLRFVSAMWVFLFHWGAFVDRKTLTGVWGAVFCGPAAVIVFFVISGFCIHYPFRNHKGDFPIFPFLVRRYLRVGIPLIVARFLSPNFHITTQQMIDAVGWSIIVELFFYSIYPFIRFPTTTRGWLQFLFCFFTLGYLVLGSHGFPRDYGSWGHEFNWLLALPCWLLGCLLASQFESLPQPTSRLSVWIYRGAIWAGSAVCAILHYHSPLPYSWTLNMLAILMFFWIRMEIVQPHGHRLARFLEWGGLWSYSLYLMHGIGLEMTRNWEPFPPQFHWLQMALKGAIVLGVCYGFYLVVEKPSHWLSRRLAAFATKVLPAGGSHRSA